MVRVETVPSLLLSSISRSSAAVLQQRLAQAQAEIATGRHYDMGLALGAGTGTDINLRLQLSEFLQTGDLAEQAGIRAGVSQSAMQSVSKLASDFLAVLTGARSAVSGQELARAAAQSAMSSFSDLMNVTFDGRYLFAGTNEGVQPLAAFQGGAPQQAVDAAFLAEFGFAQSDSATGTIGGSAMTDFLEGAFSSVYDLSGWKADWSSAGDTSHMTRIGPAQFIDASVSTDAPFARRLAGAFTAIAALGQGNLSQSAFEATVDHAITLITQAQEDLAGQQSRIGISQQRLTGLAGILATKQSAASEAIQALEAIDPYEAATRVNTLLTQLEASYTLTGRISRMSLLSYI